MDLNEENRRYLNEEYRKKLDTNDFCPVLVITSSKIKKAGEFMHLEKIRECLDKSEYQVSYSSTTVIVEVAGGQIPLLDNQFLIKANKSLILLKKDDDNFVALRVLEGQYQCLFYVVNNKLSIIKKPLTSPEPDTGNAQDVLVAENKQLSDLSSKVLSLKGHNVSNKNFKDKYYLLKNFINNFNAYSKDKAILTFYAKAVIMLSLQRRHWGFTNTTASGYAILKALKSAEFKELATLLFPYKEQASIRYRDLRALVLGNDADRDKKANERIFAARKQDIMYGFFCDTGNGIPLTTNYLNTGYVRHKIFK